MRESGAGRRNTSPTPLVLTERFARSTTQELARNLEAVGLTIQALVVTNTAMLEPTRPGGTRILLLIAAVHLVLAIAAFRRGGLFRLGGSWAVIYVVEIVLMSLVAALVLPPDRYGSEAACAQLCGYSAPPVALFAFYPWISLRRDYLRPGLQVVVVTVAIATPLAIMVAVQGYVTGVNLVSAGISGAVTITAYGIGKALGALCRSAARAQLDALREEYERLFRYLHGRVETSLAIVRRHVDTASHDTARQALDDLADAVNHERVALLLAQPHVSVAQLLNLHARRIAHTVTVARLPRVGGMTLSRDVATVLDETLSDLLKNTVTHGARTVWIDLSVAAGHCDLAVVDDGPGFLADAFDDQANSLHWLREHTRRGGGDLTLDPGSERTTVRLRLPLDVDSACARGGEYREGTASRGPSAAGIAGPAGPPGRVRIRRRLRSRSAAGTRTGPGDSV